VSLPFTIEPGKKTPGDRVLRITATDYKVTFRDIARMCRFMYINEDVLFPPPQYRGGQMFLDYINAATKAKTMEELDHITAHYHLEEK
jgi:hypothetical protein